ncbi:hypothetical protein J2Z62_000441 [Mycoplasmoides fastidiosum]|uniref:Lipoprotein and hemagglutinin (VlhA) family protein n=1 Tax=Mycoplasmoides fastidiosum TaxID=92758 RepID=A0ABU0LZH4_9BACT|nr:hypothetical protein [Mycoplasmoides fastidiosum]MDQ0514003.1 hypothetical protein [Mycoplasmoides fastidiosum]UUD37584.1 hypothetical protein NPA10_03385 [Mycoplasmoides fastidiosum]
MKKFNLFKKNKLWLASLGIATTSSLVLAACANQTQRTTNPPAGTANSTNPQTNNNSGSETNNNTPTAPEEQTPATPTPTPAQRQLANLILDDAGVKKVLEETVATNQKTITDQISQVTAIDGLNKTTVQQSITTLGTAEDPAATTNTSTIYALIKNLETTVANAQTTLVPANEKENFTRALTKVKTDAESLLASLNLLPAASDPKKLKDLEDKFTAALTTFVSATTAAETQTRLTALLEAKNAYQAEVKVVTAKLVDAEQKAFVLDSSTAALSNYVNTAVATFLTAESGVHSTTLNNLVTQVRTGVLGTLGFSVWTAGNVNVEEAKRNLPTGIEEDTTTTQLYSIIVGLANQEVAWKTINSTLKSLTYNQSLLTKTENAVNLMALHAEISVPIDVARLNAYLVHDQSNVVKLFQTTNNNLITAIDNIVNSITNYEKYLVAGSGENAKAQLVTDADDLAIKLSSNASVTGFQTAATSLVAKFKAFKDEWDKSKLAELLRTGTTENPVYPLLSQATALNQAIGVSKNYGNVVQVVGAVETLENQINAITKALGTTAENTANQLLTKLDELITDVTGTQAGSFGKALTDFAAVTDATNQAAINKIAASQTGYVYTTFVNGTAATGSAKAQLSFSQLKTEFEKLQAGNTKQLTVITNLLNNQLRPNQGSQTAALSQHLAELFNNGTVLADTETH